MDRLIRIPGIQKRLGLNPILDLVPGFGDTRNFGAGLIASALIVAAWGFFLIMGVRDPDGGVKALWPISAGRERGWLSSIRHPRFRSRSRR